MVVDHFENTDCRHFGLIYAPARERRWRVVVGLEYQPCGAAEVERVLASAISRQGMEMARSPADVHERRRGSQHTQAATNDLPLLGPEAAKAARVGLALLCEPPIGPRNLDSSCTS